MSSPRKRGPIRRVARETVGRRCLPTTSSEAMGPCFRRGRPTPDARHRPSVISGSGFAGRFVPSPPKGRAEHRAFHRARGTTWVTTWHHVLSRHMTPCTGGSAHGKQQPRTQETPAFRTRRFYRLATPSGATPPGALTECWASPHCWVLGPPTSSAGHRPFTTLQPARFTARHRTKGPQTRRVRRIPLRAGDAAGTPLCRSGTGKG